MMRSLKKIFVVALMVLLIPAGTLLSQVNKGDKELSAAVSFTHATIQEKYNGEEYSDSFSSFRLAGRLGFFITRNFEIEPEITIGKISEDIFDEAKMAYILSLNLAYNFSPDKKTVPFVLAGFGISNTIPFFHNVVIWGMEDETFKLINAGAGLKLFVGERFAVRLEYRFQHYFDGEAGFDITYTYHYGLIGISVFL